MRQRSRVSRTTASAAATAMLAAGLIAIAPQAAHAAPGSKTFNTSGGLNQQWVVPADVHSLKVTVKGAAGGAGGIEGGSGGRGASGTAIVPVTPGQLVTVYLGKRGGDAHTDNSTGEGAGGNSAGAAKGGAGGEGAFPGGGAGGGGGGATEVFLGGGLDRAIVAGGGAGGGGTGGSHTTGGNGGGADQDGQSGDDPQSEGGHAGDAPTQAGGVGDSAAFFTSGGGAGGGGGGYQGGSQGATWLGSGGAGGGGGRSYVNDLVAELDGAWTNNVEGDGSVVISYDSQFTTTTTIDDPNTVVTGQSKGYKVSVFASGTGQVPTGAIELTAENLEDGTIHAIGTKNLVNGTTTIYRDGLLVGDYTLHASYTPNGASDSLPSNADRDFAVVKGDSKTLIAGPIDPPNLGDSVDFGVAVTAVAPAKGTPTGQVKFYQGGVAIPGGTVTLDGDGKAVLTTTKLKVGVADITAEYLGDSEFEVSDDSTSLVGFVVNIGDVSVTLDDEHDSVIAGEKSKFVVDVASLTGSSTKPTGSVQLYVDDQMLGAPQAINPNTGRALFYLELPVTNPNGHHHIRAVYEGDANYKDAISNWVDHVVNFGDAKVSLSSDVNPSYVGNDVTFSIDVDGLLPTQPYEPTGEVQLYVNGTPFNAPIAIDGAGKATVTTDDLPVGTVDVAAKYLGDTKYKSADSPVLQQVVKKQSVTVNLTSSASALQFGQPLTLTATVTSADPDGEPTGQVRFYDHGSPVGSMVLVDQDGKATVTSDKVAKGVHQFSAKYFGDDNSLEGVSANVEVTVKANTLKFQLITDKMPAFQGEDVLLHARLESLPGSKGKIAGTVQYYDNGDKVGRPVPVNGVNWGSVVVRRVKSGTHRFTGKFTPSSVSSYDATTGAGVLQRVLKGKPNARVRMTVKRTSETTARVRVKVRQKKGGAALGKVQLYVDGKPVKLLTLPSNGKVAEYVLAGLPDRHVFVTANYRGNGALRQASWSVTARKY